MEFPISPGNTVASSSITLNCNVTGFPVPSVEILKDGVPLLQQDSSLVPDLQAGELFSFVSITLTDLDFFDTAEYSCSASNFLASTQTSNSVPSLYTILCKCIRALITQAMYYTTDCVFQTLPMLP